MLAQDKANHFVYGAVICAALAAAALLLRLPPLHALALGLGGAFGALVVAVPAALAWSA